MPSSQRADQNAVNSMALFVALGAFILAVFGVVAVASGGTGGGGAVVPSGPVHVVLSDFKISPNQITAPVGGKLHVENTGSQPHNFAVQNSAVRTPDLAPGKSGELDLASLKEGTYDVICTIAGHVDAGMKATLVVGSGGNSAGVQSAAGAPTAAAIGNPDDAKIDFTATPGPDWKAFDPTLAPAPGGTTHDVEMHANEVDHEVAPGVKQQLWTFNGQTPGPTLRGKVGDVFNVHLVNDGKVGHSIDFHASKVAWNDEMRTIQPGESLIYQFKAQYAGAFMYHCGTQPALHHIGNGMFGAIIIDPPDLAPVDHEYVLVQSEIYTGPQGQPGDLAKMNANQWDAVVFNGYVNQYKNQPIRVEPNQRIRVWVVDAGPSENSAFHIVGTVFDTTFKEGTYLLRPDLRFGGAQELDLQPAQGGFVEFTFAEAGLYPIVTHKFSNVGKGALGLFQAGEVDTHAAAGGH